MSAPRHLREEEMILLFYGETKSPDTAAHLRTCESCRSAYEELRAVLALLNEAPPPEPEEGYGERVWRRLQPEIERDLPPLGWWAPRRTLAAALAASLLIAAGGGLLWWRSTARPDSGQIAARRDVLLFDAVDEHLERSQRLLVELLNEPAAGSPGVRSRAQELLAANRLYRQLAARQEPGLLPPLQALELVLVEAAHSADQPPGASALASSIDANGLLFELRLARQDVERKWLQAAGITPLERSL